MEEDESKDLSAYPHLFQIILLFQDKCARPEVEAIRTALEDRFGPTETVADVDGSLSTFAVQQYQVEYKDGERVPASVLMADFAAFDASALDELKRSQLWECPEHGQIFDTCHYQLLISDFMASGLSYQDRCTILSGWLEAALMLYPSCVAVWIPSAWKLLTRQQVLDNPMEGPGRFLHFGVNIRFFHLEGTDDKLVDTLGLHAVGLPDVQYHYHGLDVNEVVRHARCVASYLFEHEVPIQSGETIDGLLNGQLDQSVQWRCQYEMALVQPEREVLDICPGEYAAGTRV